jgi:hypothetical protein
VCTPFIFDPDYNVYEVLLPTTPVPTAVPTSAVVPTPAPSVTDICQPYIPDPETGLTFYFCGPYRACSGVPIPPEGFPNTDNCAVTCERAGNFSLSTYNIAEQTCMCSPRDLPYVVIPSEGDSLFALEPEFNPPVVSEQCPAR